MKTGTMRNFRLAACMLALFAAGTVGININAVWAAEINGGYYAYDTLQNTSNLTDEEILQLYDQDRHDELKYLLDRNKDGIADGTEVEVTEFIERITIVIGTKAYIKSLYESRKSNSSHNQI